MTADTITDVVADIYQALKPLEAQETVWVSDHVPAPNRFRSPAIVVDYDGFTITELAYSVPIRCYVKASEPGVAESQQQLGKLVDLVDAQLGAESWVITGATAYMADMDVWIADFRVSVPRVLQ